MWKPTINSNALALFILLSCTNNGLCNTFGTDSKATKSCDHVYKYEEQSTILCALSAFGCDISFCNWTIKTFEMCSLILSFVESLLVFTLSFFSLKFKQIWIQFRYPFCGNLRENFLKNFFSSESPWLFFSIRGSSVAINNDKLI